jgi:UDP-3-O-[3-hydroxymyristoyl] glucosamine N-acyltransferase
MWASTTAVSPSARNRVPASPTPSSVVKAIDSTLTDTGVTATVGGIVGAGVGAGVSVGKGVGVEVGAGVLVGEGVKVGTRVAVGRGVVVRVGVDVGVLHPLKSDTTSVKVIVILCMETV